MIQVVYYYLSTEVGTAEVTPCVTTYTLRCQDSHNPQYANIPNRYITVKLKRHNEQALHLKVFKRMSLQAARAITFNVRQQGSHRDRQRRHHSQMRRFLQQNCLIVLSSVRMVPYYMSLKVTPAGTCNSETLLPETRGGHTQREWRRTISLGSFGKHSARCLHSLPVVDRRSN